MRSPSGRPFDPILRRRSSRRPWTVASALGVWLALVATASLAHAATFTVDRTDDVAAATGCLDTTPDDCSLRGAVARANSNAGADVIVVPAGTYVLSVAAPCTFIAARGENFLGSTVALCVNDDTDIVGAGAALTTIQSSGADRIFGVSAAKTAAISGVTLTGGVAAFGFAVGGGGAILNHGTLTVSASVVAGNQSAGGGGAGIYNRGTLTVVSSHLTGNTTSGSGGGIANIADAGGGTLSLVDSTLADNTGTNGGGVNSDGVASVTRSTVNRNTATSIGGGLVNTGLGRMTVVNSTISGNQATIVGGAIHNSGSSPLGTSVHLANVTITANRAPRAGGISNVSTSQTVTLRNTIVAANMVTVAAPDCQGSLTSEGYNLVQTTSGCVIAGDTTGNITGQAALLSPLVDSGGPTATHALLAGSPALDAGNPAGCTDPQGAVLATDQRGAPRSVDGDGDGGARCDMGAAELGQELEITRVQPREGGNGGPLIVVVYGSGFQAGATVALVRAGQADVLGSETSVGDNEGIILTTFDLTGKALGAWDVVVTNPDGGRGTRPGGFTVAAAGAPELWIDVIGPSLVRVGRSYRYLFLYGNRGNTDAFAVPLLVSVADTVSAVPRFEIAPPPQQPGKIVIQEWGRFYQAIIVGENPALQQFSLVLPIVPAGFSGALEVMVTPPFNAVNAPFAIRLERGEPMYDGQGPLPGAVAKLVEGARAQSARLFGYTIPVATDADLIDYLNTQLETLVEEGVASLVGSFGTAPRVYSLTQLVYDLAAFGYIWSHEHPALPMTLLPSPSRAAPGLAALGLAEEPPLHCGCGAIPNGLLCCEGCSCSTSADKDPKPPKSCLAQISQIGKDDCKRPETQAECKAIGFQVVRGKDSLGEDVAICTNNPKCIITNTVGLTCIRFPVDPKVSHDPNDKSGPLGGGPAHFITAGVPLTYGIQFENKPAATAPAAEVVVTDQLNPALVDLTTLALGPVGFGQTQIVPPPGSTEFLRDVDLRPATNLIVRIDARLDPATARLTWRFTSLDPATMELPEDPLAGFLPPNVTPPEGDGFVAFTVDPQPELATGTEIANQARIVFDVNPPIDTPVWRNAIDATPPTSSVTSVTPGGACTQDLLVAWSGSDQDSGIGAFSILVSEEGGPFTRWLATDATSGTFHGKWGARYSFVSVAEDRAGNVEASPALPGVAAIVAECGPHDLAVTRISAPRTVKLTSKRPAKTAVVKVDVQNRSAQSQTIADEAALANLVTLAVQSLGACPPARVSLQTGRRQTALPFVLGPKKKLGVAFDVVLDCPEPFGVSAAVHQATLGGLDAHPDDDVCPRPGLKPPIKDAFPDGRIREAGCGGRRADGTLGGPIVIGVTGP